MTKRSDVPAINCRSISEMPITYQHTVEEQYEAWASDCGWEPERLRTETEKAIRTRHQEARVDKPWHRAHGQQPDIFTLSLGNVDTYFTVEPHAVVVRGYGTEPRDDRQDDENGGICYDNSWFSSPEEFFEIE